MSKILSISIVGLVIKLITNIEYPSLFTLHISGRQNNLFGCNRHIMSNNSRIKKQETRYRILLYLIVNSTDINSQLFAIASAKYTRK